MILHFSQIFFTDGLTFILLYQPFLILLCSPGYASFSEVVNRNLNGNAVAGQNSYIIHSELSRNMCSNYMLIGKLYLEGCIGQSLNYNAFKFNNIILWQNNPSSTTIFVIYLPILINERCTYNAIGGKHNCVFIVR